jgi:hypothetical protein
LFELHYKEFLEWQYKELLEWHYKELLEWHYKAELGTSLLYIERTLKSDE